MISLVKHTMYVGRYIVTDIVSSDYLLDLAIGKIVKFRSGYLTVRSSGHLGTSNPVLVNSYWNMYSKANW